jgi:hypothetical protein
LIGEGKFSFQKTSDLAETGAEGIGIGLTVSDLGIGSPALALGVEGLALGGVVAEISPAPSAGQEAIRGAEVGGIEKLRDWKLRGLKIRDWKSLLLILSFSKPIYFSMLSADSLSRVVLPHEERFDDVLEICAKLLVPLRV